jgi:predicted dehydrogenase
MPAKSAPRKGSRYRVAVIGTGMIATAGHIPAWKNLADDVEIVAVADLQQDRAELVARTEGIPRGYGDWRRMLAESEPDIVSVCTPNAHHREPTIAALQAGAHVLCEKPVATSLADATAMFDAAQKADRVLFVGQSSRFFEKSIAAREVASSGRLGKIYFGETVAMCRRGIPTWGQFHMKRFSGGGPIYDLGVHTIDLLYWLMGNPRAVAVSSLTWTMFGNHDEGLVTSLAESGAPLGVLTPRPFHPSEFDVEDMAVGLIRMDGGASIMMKTSWAANIPQETSSTTILGDEGGLTMDPLTLVTREGPYQANLSPLVPADRSVMFAGHWGETAHFVRVLKGEEQLIVKKDEVLNVMATLDALYRSAAEGREVRIG